MSRAPTSNPKQLPGRLALAGLLVPALALAACGPVGQADSRLNLRFARQAIAGPCPENIADDSAPPDLDEVRVVLTRPDGSRHYAKSVRLDGSKPARFGAIPPGQDLALQVTGLVGGSPQWAGSAQALAVFEGRTTHADVFMTRVADLSCTARPLQRPRALLAAAPTGGGQVLLAGGIEQRLADACGPGCSEWLASPAADLFDPATGVVYGVPRMHTPRALATATRLPWGGVLVVGGATRVRTIEGSGVPFEVDPADLVDTFEVYLPAERRWIEKPLPDRQGRVFHTATGLPDGRVLVAGGGASFAEARDDAWLFDPEGESVGEFVRVTDHMATPRMGHAAVLVGEKVILLGGALLPTKSPVEEFNLSGQDGGFSEALIEGSPINPFFHDAIVLPLRPDEILLAGGSLFDGVSQLLVPTEGNTRIYSVSRGAFSDSGSMQIARLFPRLVALGDDTVLLAGGYSDLDLTPDDAVEIFNPAGSFETEASLSTPRGGHAVVAVGGGRALVVGGWGPAGLLASGEVFTPAPAP